MAKMTDNTFATLYELGQQVYRGEIDIREAAALASSKRPEIAISSAQHYILWYSKMRVGEHLTWNSNSDLLLYYARRIITEEGIDAGALAIQGAKQFAKHVSRAELENDLDCLAIEKGILLSDRAVQKQHQSQKDMFKQWLTKLENNKYTDSTIYRYIRALEMAEEWLSFEIECPILSIATYEEFENCAQTLKALPNFAQVNQAHGHGDLSAALSLYSKFLKELDSLKKSFPIGTFDSWEIIDENTAVKHCDKSFFDYRGSGVPKGICWFFGAEDMNLGETKIVKLIHNGKQYQGSIKNESSDRRRVRIFWSTELGGLFDAFNVPEATATFKKIADDTYEVSIRGGETEMTIKEKIAAIKAYIAARGFNYEGDLIENFYLSLKSKPFVILAGTSGTGKTKLVEYFAEAIGAKMQLVPVRPDWSDSSDLFGHKDLSGNFHPGAIIDFIKSATDSPSVPHFLCLDEMNLARVEYYMSDLLSIIETRRFNDQHKVVTKPLIAKDYCLCANGRNDYGELGIPDNLYIIGTVNMDETTFPFSKKVLDRANTIEFSFVDLTRKALPFVQSEAQELDNSFLKAEYLHLIDCGDDQLIDDICFDLNVWNQILVKANLHVGYRVRDEICFYMMNNKKSELLDFETAFDHEIMQKILPRVQGSSSAIKDVLSELFVKCAGDYAGFGGTAAYEQMQSYLDTKPCKYPNSAKKIAFMMRRYEEDGFTSYWL